MHFNLSQELIEKLSTEENYNNMKPETTTLPFYQWYGGSVQLGYDDLIVLTHELSGLTLLFLNAYEEDLSEFEDWFEEALFGILERIGFQNDAILSYLDGSPIFTFTEDADDRIGDKLAPIIEKLQNYPELMEEEYIFQEKWSSQINRLLSNYKSDYSANELFMQEWEKRMGHISIKTEMAELEIRLKRKNEEDRIRIVHVPMNITFDELHTVIQNVYLWKTRHLYHFILGDGTRFISAKEKLTNRMERYAQLDYAYSGSSYILSDELSTGENAWITYVYGRELFFEHTVFVRKTWTVDKPAVPKLVLMMGDPVDEGAEENHDFPSDGDYSDPHFMTNDVHHINKQLVDAFNMKEHLN